MGSQREPIRDPDAQEVFPIKVHMPISAALCPSRSATCFGERQRSDPDPPRRLFDSIYKFKVKCPVVGFRAGSKRIIS